mgnify:CR=1 FL=1
MAEAKDLEIIFKVTEDISVREAGQRGGNATKRKHGSAFYSEIGKIGGAKLLETRGHEFYVEIGRKGGSRGKGGRKANERTD